MPQASEVTRNEIKKLFGSLDDSAVALHLMRHGYELNQERHTWSKPGVTELWQMTSEQLLCMSFLVDEWDYGGLWCEENE